MKKILQSLLSKPLKERGSDEPSANSVRRKPSKPKDYAIHAEMMPGQLFEHYRKVLISSDQIIGKLK